MEISRVEFRDSTELYRSPPAVVNNYRTFMQERFHRGAPWIRIIGRPVWSGRSQAEIDQWTRYESLLNLAFASFPATIVCPYDARVLPKQIVTDARTTHPKLAHAGETTESLNYRAPEEFLLTMP